MLDRLTRLADGRDSYLTKYGHGARVHRIMTVTELMARIAALVPSPRHPLTRYHGSFAPGHSFFGGSSFGLLASPHRRIVSDVRRGSAVATAPLTTASSATAAHGEVQASERPGRERPVRHPSPGSASGKALSGMSGVPPSGTSPSRRTRRLDRHVSPGPGVYRRALRFRVGFAAVMPGLPSDVLCAYLEPLVSNARVVVLGDAATDTSARLVEAGARSVRVFDPDSERARTASSAGRVVVVEALPAGDLDARAGAFDVALVPDLSALPDPAAWLARLRRVLGAEGVLLACAPNPDVAGTGIGYYELYDMVALQFAAVRMIAALPFRGTTLAELGQDEVPEVTVETALAGEAPPPLAYLALAAQEDRPRLAPYSIVQHSASDAVATPSFRAESGPPGTLAESGPPGALAEPGAASTAQDDVTELERLLSERASVITNLRAELVRREKLARELIARLGDAQAAAPPVPTVPADAELRGKLDALALELARRESDLEAARWRVAEVEQRLDRPERGPGPGRTKHGGPGPGRTRHGGPAADRTEALEPALAATPEGAEEVQALRQALVEEHAARVRAESGEELAHARGELQRQAVLLGQLGTERR